MTDPMQRLEQDFARILAKTPVPDAPVPTDQGWMMTSKPKMQ